MSDMTRLTAAPGLIFLGGILANGWFQSANPVSRVDPAFAAPLTITVEANDFALSLPARVPAGIVTFHLVNHGKESHHLQVVRLEQGKTIGDFVDTFTDTRAMPSWVQYLGGPVGTAPGEERSS
ncbi:MAG: hypothetical protein ACREOQ_07780, partial [Gemmatimonadales bacterium]